ncbi:locomotion-related protein Hikaru genki [Trichonephila inaurata madagascariensis]|uniref:Locomotion-related protein Hikaru genki n=1 Tax=Trichonephila inaurata madagascariensis TaxID=2747483 RepID=A0A8X6YJ23_9ARAC|nr:locomotion-related protein Hikaru genki [Trichonephila inaurata madagascariensis]
MLRQCFLSPPGPDVVMSFEGKELNLENEVALPHGSIIELRCSEVGLFKFVGQPVIRCGNGQWNAPPPLCQPTSVQKNFSSDAAPTITYNVVSGDAGITSSGQVVILPNSIIHFDCLWQRQDGNPNWTWTATHRHVYCALTDIQCPAINSLDRNRVMAVEGNKMHSQARFACMEGFNLIGPEEITCTASGSWSETPPYCEGQSLDVCENSKEIKISIDDLLGNYLVLIALIE